MSTGAAPSGAQDAEARLAALLLSFAGGFVDTFSFVVLFGLFTAHVTGNFVLIGAALAHPSHHGIVGKLLALPMFIAAVAAARWLQRRRERRGLGSARLLVAVQLALLVVFMMAGQLLGPFDAADDAVAVATGLVGVAAMAVQNAASRGAFAHLSPTTVMTGNVTQVTMDLVDRWLGDAAAGPGPGSARIAKMWPPIVAFAVGAVAAGFTCRAIGFACLLLPIAALLVLWWRLRAAAPSA